VRKNYGPIYAMPVALWISVFFVVPISIIFLYSFLEKGLYGGVVWKFSLDAYYALSNSTFLKVALITIVLSIAATIITLLLALPTAYFIARSAYKNFLLFLVIIPFWTNFLIRIYAWIAILGNNGFLNNFLIILESPIHTHSSSITLCSGHCAGVYLSAFCAFTALLDNRKIRLFAP